MRLELRDFMHSQLCHCNAGLAWILSCMIVLLAAGPASATPQVERISFAPRSDGQGLVVRLHTSAPLTAYSRPHFRPDGRLEVILFNTDAAGRLQQDAPAAPIRAYHVASESGHLYIAFQLNPDAEVQVDAYRDHASNDILLGVALAGSEPVVALTPPERVERLEHPVRTASVSEVPVDGVDQSRWKLDTIVIDAGHGGHDTGAVGAGGLREKDIVLPVALKVGQYIEEHLGVNVVYTREDDRFITLRDRGRIANREGGKLFISIHANAARNRSAYGAETYFLGMHKTDAARTVMERENSVIRLENDPDAYDGLNQEALIVQTLAQSAYMRKSEELAGLIQNQFTDRVGRKNRGVKQAGFYVLWSASMPSILVELGFVTNSDEAAFLRSESGQDYLASAIFRAVRDFKTRYEKGLEYVVHQ